MSTLPPKPILIPFHTLIELSPRKMTITNNNNNLVNCNNQFGDTSLTKVFVGGLAWETPKEAMKDHFDKYGEILEAVVISDKLTGRSKGYGFVTFKDPEAAKKACQDATPIINGRRANCNLASLGARRQKPSSSPVDAAASVAVPAPTTLPPLPLPLPRQGSNVVGLRAIPTTATATATNPQVQWYYPAGAITPLPYHHHHAIPFFGYSPTYISPDISYNHKLSYNGGGGGGGGGGGTYMNGHYIHHHHHHQVYPGQNMLHANNTLVPMYSHHHPLYHPYHHHHQTHTTMGLPAHIFPTTTTASGPIATVPATILSKPASIPPPLTNSGTLSFTTPLLLHLSGQVLANV